MLLEFFQVHCLDLSKKGIQPDYWIQNMENGIRGTVHANDVQETLKAQQKSATQDLKRWDSQLYKLVSGAIDAAAGAYGKNTPEAKQLLRFRSKMHRPEAVKEETAQQ